MSAISLSDEWKAYTKTKTDWQVKFNMNPNITPRYKGSIVFPHPLYVGLDRKGIIHEFGHQLGLDDEYGPRNSDCNQIHPANIANQYIMCNSWGSVRPDQQKGIYAWLATRRYAIAKVFNTEGR